MINQDLHKIDYSFVIGIGRSGTTLLSKLLNQHRNCIASLEIEFLIFFDHAFSDKTKFSDEDLKLIVRFFDLYALRHPVLKLILDTEALYKKMSAQKIDNYRDLTTFLHLQFNFLEKPLNEIKQIVDKNPSYTLHVEKLLKFAPGSRFVFMVRDYRANILSRKQSIEFRSPDVAFNAYRWRFYNKKGLSSMAKRKDRVMMLKYEELAGNPDQQMLKVIDFLGLPADAESLKFYQGKIPQQFDIEKIKKMRQRYDKTFGDIEKTVFTDRVKAWEQQLSENEIKICEVICGGIGEKLGYKKKMKISMDERAVIRIKSLPCYLWAAWDYYKEFLLFYIPPAVKLKRIANKNKSG